MCKSNINYTIKHVPIHLKTDNHEKKSSGKTDLDILLGKCLSIKRCEMF